jgi:hypothetical protein
MPHSGLMDEKALGPESASLQRARLHIRAGKRRLRQGKISTGWLTLYDALLFAMDWYIASPERRKNLAIKETEDLRDDKTLFSLLKRSGVIDDRFDYEVFKKRVYSPSPEKTEGYDLIKTLKAFESLMTRLGVMPFDGNKLPPEDPSTD